MSIMWNLIMIYYRHNLISKPHNWISIGKIEHEYKIIINIHRLFCTANISLIIINKLPLKLNFLTFYEASSKPS